MDLRATRVEISVKNFKNNLAFFRSKLATDCPLCLVVKANAYGHGLIEMAECVKDDVEMLAVAAVNEGVRLREAGMIHPILVMSAHVAAEIPTICKYNLIPFVSHSEYIEQYQKYAEQYNIKLPLHIKVDTGMGRSGLMPNEVLDVAKKILSHDNLILEGVCMHFSEVEKKETADQQLAVFNSVVDELKQNDITPKYVHAANSVAIVYRPDSHFNLVRLGVGVYGYNVFEPEIRPVMSFKSKVTIEKVIPKGHGVSYGSTWVAEEDTKVGVIPVGFADGYMRAFSNKGKVLIDGKFCPIIGRVCMDQMVVALPDNGDYLEKDVLLFGDNDELTAFTLASQIGSIATDITTAVSTDRVPRIYFDE